jgi:hypothetical protein
MPSRPADPDELTIRQLTALRKAIQMAEADMAELCESPAPDLSQPQPPDGTESWYYLSFCDGKRPTGTRFLGAAYVQASSEWEAIVASHRLGINPVTRDEPCEVAFVRVTDEEMAEYVPEKDRERLLTREEAEG